MKRRIARKIARRGEAVVRPQTWDRVVSRLSDAEFEELVCEPFRKYMGEHFGKLRTAIGGRRSTWRDTAK